MKEKIVLIDGHSILNRAFFGIPDLTNSEGLHTNAVYGFLNILFKILDEEKPQYLTVAFDRSEPTFRHKMYAEYKGTRKPMADELREQVPVIKEVLLAMGIPVKELPGYEADDILGTLGRIAEESGMEVRIVSGDRDLLQLATEHTMIRIPKTKRQGTEIEDYLAKDVLERYQVTPKEFIDVKALMGDSSDNIPGVPGIGEKTATSLIATYKSIENAYAHIDEITNKRAQNNLREHYDLARMSKELAEINTHSPVTLEPEEARIGDLFTQEAYVLFKRLEFKNMLARFEGNRFDSRTEEEFRYIETGEEMDDFLAALDTKKLALTVYENENWTEGCEADGQMTLFASENDRAAERFYGAALSDGCGHTAFLKTGKVSGGELLDALGGLILRTETLISSDLKRLLKVLYQTPDEKQPTQQADEQGTEKSGLNGGAWPVRGGWLDRTSCEDVSIAAYLLNPLKNSYDYDDLANEYLNEMLPSMADLFGKTKPEKAVTEKPEAFFKMACYEVYTQASVIEPLKKKLEETGMSALYREVEIPVAFVLADMEREGVRVDGMALKEYARELSGRIERLEDKIYEQAGEEFNINSPKQLGRILFETLGMPHAKKTKTGYSTAADVLEKLAPEYSIVSDILEYRTLSKLKSTYAEGLGKFIDPDGRIRTSFQQTVTATGRLSSTDPNLQNIPIRMEEGRLIRKVFIPKEGCVFVDADYSQIELRLLAHMSDDASLIDAYRQSKDIHRITASLVFHTPFEEVTPLQRRNAKAVNFGIVYGISSFGLSQDLSITRAEAEEYIRSYFETYPGIKTFLDQSVADAKDRGYAVTLYGRRRPVPELSSGNFMQRQFGERIAMNSPIQGTAADIIKIAMIRVHDRLKREGLKSRLLLQVHDELLVEAPADEEEKVRQILDEEMRHAATLKVELEVGMESGQNWYEAH